MIRNVLKLKSIGNGCKKKVKRMTGMIKQCTDLYEQLTRCSLFDKRQNLTIRETRLIVDYLGLLEGCFDDKDETVSTT